MLLEKMLYIRSHAIIVMLPMQAKQGDLLSTRVKEHRNHINRKTGQSSVITDHRLLNHEFDWEGVEILDEERNLNKRLMSEIY